MKKLNKKGFTIVELVIVIAVIAILAAVLIPTFSGVVSRANQSAALQTARSTLTNALNMSSTATLSGQTSTKKYTTMIVVDGYAFGYNGNQLEQIDYPNSTEKTFKIKSGENYNTYNTFNAIMIAAENLTYGGNKSAADGNPTTNTVCNIKNVNLIIEERSENNELGCTNISDISVVYVDGHYYIASESFVEKTDESVVSGKTYYTKDTNGVYSVASNLTSFASDTTYYVKSANPVEIYVNSDFSNKVVVFTTFG